MPTPAGGELFHILIGEDLPGDVRLILEALKRVKVRSKLSVVDNGEEVLAFLREEGTHSNAGLPDIILLDLNLPKKNGLEALAEIKADKELRRIPVLVFTSSAAEQDIQKAYSLHANCYVVKPAVFEQYVSVIGSIVNFWFNIVKLPLKGAKRT